MRQRFLLPILLIFIFESSPYGAASLFAQNLTSQDTVQAYKYDFSRFGHETWSFVHQPMKWDGGDWLKVGLIGAGSFLMIETADQPVRNAVLRDQRYFKSAPVEFGRIWGELYTPGLLCGGLVIHSFLAADERTRKIGYEIGQASLYAGAVTQLLKITIGRARPSVNKGPREFHPFSSFLSKQDYQSHPSGHNTIAFAISTVLSRNARPVWLKGVAYMPAALTFISRVYQDRHWMSDDFLGAAVGYIIADWVVDLHEQGESRVHISSIFPFTISVTLD